LVAANLRGTPVTLRPSRPVEVESRPDIVTLRVLRESDRESFCEAVDASMEQLTRWVGLFRRIGLSPDARLETLDELFDRQLALSSLGERSRASCRRVGVLGDGRIIGAFNLNAISRGLEFQAEASWWIATPWAGRGLATLGVRRLLDLAFGESHEGGLGLHKVLANIQPDNATCQRVAMKLGFRRVPGVVSMVPVGDAPQKHELFARSVLDE